MMLRHHSTATLLPQITEAPIYVNCCSCALSVSSCLSARHILCATCFGACMTVSGMLRSITSLLVRFTRSRVGLVSSTVTSGLFLNTVVADQYMSIILSANMFKDSYDREGYEHRLLSRSIEDSCTVTSVLVPWNSCGMTQATVLNVSTFTYLPYCFFNIISPFMSIFISILGYKIYRKGKSSK